MTLSRAVLWYLSLLSKPMKSLLFLADATAVVPEPMNGSRTTSPSLLLFLMMFSMMGRGLMVGCPYIFLSFMFVGRCQTVLASAYPEGWQYPLFQKYRQYSLSDSHLLLHMGMGFVLCHIRMSILHFLSTTKYPMYMGICTALHQI